MKIAVYQGPSPEGDIERALKVVETSLSSVSAAGAKMIVFPELFLPGYNQPALHKSKAQPQAGLWEENLASLAARYACGLTIGWAERDDEAIFNSVSCFNERGDKVVHYRKIQLFGSAEKSTFQVGDQYQTFSLNGYKAAVLICYDIEFAHHVQALKEEGVELLLVPTANPKAYDNVPEFIVPARAAENGMTIVYANYCGQEDGLAYGGKSLIVGPDAGLLAKAGQGEVLLLADLNVIQTIDQAVLSTQSEDRRVLASTQWRKT